MIIVFQKLWRYPLPYRWWCSSPTLHQPGRSFGCVHEFHVSYHTAITKITESRIFENALWSKQYVASYHECGLFVYAITYTDKCSFYRLRIYTDNHPIMEVVSVQLLMGTIPAEKTSRLSVISLRALEQVWRENLEGLPRSSSHVATTIVFKLVATSLEYVHQCLVKHNNKAYIWLR